MIAIGIDLGGTNIKAALVDEKEGILKKISIPTEAQEGKEHVFEQLAYAAKLLLEDFDQEVIGIGLGIPGMVELDQKTVNDPPNLPGWQRVNVSNELEKRSGLKCFVENDANVAALGSAFFGAGKGYNSFITLTLGTGVGGGIYHNKKLFKGVHGMAGELGHMIIDYKGPYSNSVTRGTVEAFLGQRFMSAYAAEIIKEHPENELYKEFYPDFEKLEPQHLTQAADKGNELAIEIYKQSGSYLGYAIVNYAHMFDIRTFIVSGGVAKAGEWLFKPARETALASLMPPYRNGFELIYEDLGNDSALLGSAGLAFQSFS